MSGASLLFAILVAEPQAPATEGNPYLLQARLLYERLEPAACLKRLEQATHWDNTREEQLEIELFGGLCAYFVGNEKAAAERFELALRLRPEAKLPPRTSPKIEALFDRVRARVKAAPESAPPSLLLPALPERASLGATEVTGSTEATANLRAPPARPLAQRLVGPIALGAAAIIAATVAIIFGAMAKDFEGKANGLKYESDRALWVQYGDSARFYASASNWGSGATGALALGAGGWLALSFLTEPQTRP